mgnify:CR=1 FL=1
MTEPKNKGGRPPLEGGRVQLVVIVRPWAAEAVDLEAKRRDVTRAALLRQLIETAAACYASEPRGSRADRGAEKGDKETNA